MSRKSKKPSGGKPPEPSGEGLSFQQRVEMLRARRRELGQRGTAEDGQAADDVQEELTSDRIRTEDRAFAAAAVAAASAAAASEEAAGPVEKKVEKKADPAPEAPAEAPQPPRDKAAAAPPKASPPPAGGPASLSKAIAQRRAALEAKMRGEVAGDDEEDAPPAENDAQGDEAPPAGAKDAAAKDATPASGDDDGVSLQDAMATGQGEPAGKGSQTPTDSPRADAASAASGGRSGPAGVAVASAGGRLMHVMLVANTFLLALVGGVLIYVLSRQGGGATAAEAAMAALAAVEKHKPQPATRPAGEPNAPAVRPMAALVEAPPWAVAEAAYQREDYNKALQQFGQLLLASRRIPSEAMAGEFFSCRIAGCLWRLGRLEGARRILDRLTGSGSPAVRASANSHLARMADDAKQHLRARMLAYRAIAAAAAMTTDLELTADCDYLIARGLTEKVRRFHTTERIVPWSHLAMSDAFVGRPEGELRQLLRQGTGQAGRADEDPVVRIRKVGDRWSLAAWNVSVQDLLHQFASKTGRDVDWQGVSPSARRRTVGLYVREASEQRVCEVACGMAGLVARLTWDQVLVHDPQAVTTLSKQNDLLAREAISSWRRFALRRPDDARVPQANFALAALYEWSGDTVGAMTQYQLVARQHQGQAEIAPSALIRCAKLRVSLRDYAGARTNLLDLRDLFPHYRKSDEVYLFLGQVYMQVGQFDKAISVLLRVRHMDCSPESRRRACLEAGECYFRKGEYKEASTWLGRYITSLESLAGSDLPRAYLLLGRAQAAQGDLLGAAEALRRALATRPEAPMYVQTVLALADVRRRMDDLVGAMGTLRLIEAEPLPPAQTYRYLMLASKVYRAMGLPDQARAFLRKRGLAVTDMRTRALIAMEQARCLQEAGELRAARQGMSEAIRRLQGGREAWEASLDLGELCLEMDDADQAAVVAEEALRSRCGDETRRRALRVLARAQLRKKNYEKAAASLAALGTAAPPPPAAPPAAKPGGQTQ